MCKIYLLVVELLYSLIFAQPNSHWIVKLCASYRGCQSRKVHLCVSDPGTRLSCLWWSGRHFPLEASSRWRCSACSSCPRQSSPRGARRSWSPWAWWFWGAAWSGFVTTAASSGLCRLRQSPCSIPSWSQWFGIWLWPTTQTDKTWQQLLILLRLELFCRTTVACAKRLPAVRRYGTPFSAPQQLIWPTPKTLGKPHKFQGVNTNTQKKSIPNWWLF